MIDDSCHVSGMNVVITVDDICHIQGMNETLEMQDDLSGISGMTDDC
jgi:hypothetical protein